MQASTAASGRALRPSAEAGSGAELAGQLLALWLSITRAGGMGAYAIFEELDLTLTQVKALSALSDAELTVKELAER
ncbi:MAG: hypothetical protein ACRDLN_13805, partial [Solirubrobacteraceae bacterium]